MKKLINGSVFIRSIYNLGDFNDDERDFGPSLTDPSQDEPIEALVARLMRGEMVGHGEPEFDTDSQLDAASVFGLQAETSKDGFDFADIPAIEKRGIKAAKALENKPAAPPPPVAEKPKEEAVKPKEEAVKPIPEPTK